MAAKGLPPLQRIVEFLRLRLFGQELVGIDRAGNKYYSWREKTDVGEVVEKRRVKVPGNDVLYNPHSLQPEWRAWLTRTRSTPPTDEELLRGEERAAALRARVAAIDAREAQRRFRAASLGRDGAAGPDLQSFTAQLENQGFGRSDGGSNGGGMAASDQGAGPGGGPGSGPGTRPSGTSPGGGGGGGESFKPGVWTPGGGKQ